MNCKKERTRKHWHPFKLKIKLIKIVPSNTLNHNKHSNQLLEQEIVSCQYSTPDDIIEGLVPRQSIHALGRTVVSGSMTCTNIN